MALYNDWIAIFIKCFKKLLKEENLPFELENQRETVFGSEICFIIVKNKTTFFHTLKKLKPNIQRNLGFMQPVPDETKH